MKYNNIRDYSILFFLSFFLFFISCDKLVSIPEPVNSITSKETFSTDANAMSALSGMYVNLSFSNGNNNFATISLSALCGNSADELNTFGTSTDAFQLNNLLESEGRILVYFWSPMYSCIYDANAIIEGVAESKSITMSARQQLNGEAKFLRAFNNFYLVNLFGDVPLVTSTAWAKNNLLPRTMISDVYKQIIADLKESQNLLTSDYAFTNGNRIRANKWAATALLARTYLYTEDWKNAELEASKVISNTGQYALLNDLNGVFLKNNDEAIWQLEVPNRYPYATREGANFVPSNPPYSSPNYYLTDYLLAAFEKGDKRRVAWLDSSISSGEYYAAGTYYYPYKYKIFEGTSGNISECYTLLRLAEQYLIRAEARARQNNLIQAIEDVNVIRKRAGLADLSLLLSQGEVLTAIAQENRIEFFAELGHRWLDLKRTKKADAVLYNIKGSNWQNTDNLYPIPLAERKIDPNLTQNLGY